MADRAVYQTRKDRNGDITALCNDGEWWSPVDKDEAISHIEDGSHRYYVPWQGGRTEIEVVYSDHVSGGRYLRTNHDGTSRNNLDDLPDC